MPNSAPPPSFSDVYYSQQPSSNYQTASNTSGQTALQTLPKPNQVPALTAPVSSVRSDPSQPARYGSMTHQISELTMDQSFRQPGDLMPGIDKNVTIPQGPQPSLSEVQAVKPVSPNFQNYLIFSILYV